MSTPKYNWDLLKREFLISNDTTIKGFCERKKMPIPTSNSYVARKTSGWAGEKKNFKEKALKKYIKSAEDEALADTKKIRLKQAKIADDVIQKAVDYLKKDSTKINSVEQARKLLDTGIKIERDALGISNKVGKDQNLTQINLYVSKFGKIFEDADEQETRELLKAVGVARRELANGDREQTSGIAGSEASGEDKELPRLG